MSTHSAVYARLFIDGQDRGLHTFIVPLRDDNHYPLPGIIIGDCGRKMGLEGVDNGWIQVRLRASANFSAPFQPAISLSLFLTVPSARSYQPQPAVDCIFSCMFPDSLIT